jgi:hypothetical protein
MRVLAATQGVKACIKRRIALTSIYDFCIILSGRVLVLNRFMSADLLVAHGNQCREENNPEQALAFYAQAFVQDRNNASAFNNYGNVLREIGDPVGAIPFLQRAVMLDPSNTTAPFNIAVAQLLAGDYVNGWKQYETRWQFEHMAGTLPTYTQPRWHGEDLKDKTIFVVGEQGHGDNIQFVRFMHDLKQRGATVLLQVNQNLMPLFEGSTIIDQLIPVEVTPDKFDYWTPIMSVAGNIGVTVDNLSKNMQYLTARPKLTQEWLARLGPKKRLRVGFCWSGRRDSWINRHKAMPFETMLALIKQNPNYEWINLQLDCTVEEEAILVNHGLKIYPGTIRNFADTAGLISTLDVVLSVDTAIGHLSCALGRPTWIMLNNFAVDWRWMLNRDDNPWYPTARLFRQPAMGDWSSVTNKIHQFLSWFKI